MQTFNIDAENIDKELVIDDSSVYSLVEALKLHPRKEAKYQRLAAMASKEVARLELELEVLTAELIDKAMQESGATSASARQELRKGGISKYPKYQEKKKELYEAKETADILNGLVYSWTSRGYLLREIVKIADRTMMDAPRVYRSGELKEKSDKIAEGINKGE